MIRHRRPARSGHDAGVFVGRYPLERSRRLAHRLRGRGSQTGPTAVAEGLVRGLHLIGVDIPIVSAVSGIGRVTGVLTGRREDLHRLCESRRGGKIERLIVGPNCLTLPSDVPFADVTAIDQLIVPCQWVADLYRRDVPDCADRITIWPAGVDTRYWTPLPGDRDSVLIYDKTFDERLVARCASAVEQSRLVPEVVQYGTYSAAEYRDALRRARFMIWISRSESQGIALFESWACDVPTLCIDMPEWRASAPAFLADSSPAPYLTSARGSLLEEGGGDFEAAIMAFAEHARSLNPHETIHGRHDLESAARAYTSLLFGEWE